MVCEKCQKKLSLIVTPDTWKDGARNTTESGTRVINENKATTSKRTTTRYNPYTTKFEKVFIIIIYKFRLVLVSRLVHRILVKKQFFYSIYLF